MSDIIKLLPDSVANQIAAGEVVQRPASVVKELIENSIDAGASDIKLVAKDAGRTLVQVTDNGNGMSESDARMSFERHATSKIDSAKDLFALRTMGFRGEALASIASVARVEMKSRQKEVPLGTEIIIEGSKLISQQPCQAAQGTTIAVKNLFFNTPARRNFLKSDNVEKAHVFNEFLRVALAYPEISFSYYHNDKLITQANNENKGHRIVSLFGNHYKERLIPVEEKTQIVEIEGYVLKPEFAKKRRGDQFFFVNNRYIKSPYLNHAVENAFSELIPDDSHPSFFLFLNIDPSQIDVNVHPTKTEIKFQDEKTLYQILKVCVKRSLGKFNIAPTLDFEQDGAFSNIRFDKEKPVVPPTIDVDPDYNPFNTQKSSTSSGKNLAARTNPQQWEKLFPQPQHSGMSNRPEMQPEQGNQHESKQTIISAGWDEEEQISSTKKFMHLHGRYILSSIKSGLMILDQQRVHERILFEKHLKILKSRKSSSQTLLFPEQIKLTEHDTHLLEDIMGDVAALGFEINKFGKNSFMVNAVPTEIAENENLQSIIESILDNFKRNSADVKLEAPVNVARALAKSMSVKYGKVMSEAEMNALTDELFSCEMPYQTPSGKPTLTIIKQQEISGRLK